MRAGEGSVGTPAHLTSALGNARATPRVIEQPSQLIPGPKRASYETLAFRFAPAAVYCIRSLIPHVHIPRRPLEERALARQRNGLRAAGRTVSDRDRGCAHTLCRRRERNRNEAARGRCHSVGGQLFDWANWTLWMSFCAVLKTSVMESPVWL